MHGTSEHQLNPIANWAFTVTRVMSIDGWNKSWTVGTAIKKGRVGQITGAEIAKIFKTAVDDIGKDVLGFSTKDVGTRIHPGCTPEDSPHRGLLHHPRRDGSH
mmetsp:Transcript_42474/g.128882  ORF Transcript_42474/g.128882 Transcript_42474/m.128882 type:complete len:103 (+) Transcript_42474:573-881(+)